MRDFPHDCGTVDTYDTTVALLERQNKPKGLIHVFIHFHWVNDVYGTEADLIK